MARSPRRERINMPIYISTRSNNRSLFVSPRLAYNLSLKHIRYIIEAHICDEYHLVVFFFLAHIYVRTSAL